MQLRRKKWKVWKKSGIKTALSAEVQGGGICCFNVLIIDPFFLPNALRSARQTDFCVGGKRELLPRAALRHCCHGQNHRMKHTEISSRLFFDQSDWIKQLMLCLKMCFLVYSKHLTSVYTFAWQAWLSQRGRPAFKMKTLSSQHRMPGCLLLSSRLPVLY